MKLYSSPILTISTLLSGFFSGVFAAPNIITPDEPTIWSKVEFKITDIPKVDNPFDPDQIAIDAVITTPSGKKINLPAFWQQPFERALIDGHEQLTRSGDPQWNVRYTPTESGKHRIQILTSIANKQLDDHTSIDFEVSGSAPKGRYGFVRIAPDNRYFQTDDGNLLKLIGENICWDEGRRSYDFDKWMEAMASSGQNFGRLWMAPWWMALEHDKDGLTNYSQSAAWHIDYVLQKAEELGMYLMVSQNHHGMYQLIDPMWGGSNTFWSTNNPYNKDFGGPCETPNDFFSNPEAKNIFKKKLRYLVARYGYSQNLLNWQFFNEIDNAFIRAPLNPDDVYAWHEEMANWFAENDPYDHLVTTSLTGGSDRPEVWNIENIDYTMFHSYWDPAPARLNATIAESFIKRYQKPYMIGEFGTNAYNLNIDNDPHMRGFRQGLWGGIMGGSVGTSMTWWWEEVHRQNLYPIYKTIREVMDEAGWEDGNWVPINLGRAPQPESVGNVIEDSLPFSADLAMMNYDRITLSGKVAITDKLSTKRSSEYLQTFLKPASWRSGNLRLRSADKDSVNYEIEGRFTSNASIVFNINSVAADTQLTVLVDEEVKFNQHLTDTDGDQKNSNELNEEYSINIPEGKHRIVFTNTGEATIQFNSIRLNRIQPSRFSNDWSYQPDVLALGNGKGSAVLYVVSQHIVYPAGSKSVNPTKVRGFKIPISNFPQTQMTVKWVNPTNGEVLLRDSVSYIDSNIALNVPSFNEDLIAIIKPQIIE